MCSKTKPHITRPRFYSLVYFVISEDATLSSTACQKPTLMWLFSAYPEDWGASSTPLLVIPTQIYRASSILGDGDASGDGVSGCLTEHVVVSPKYNSNEALFDRGRNYVKLNIKGGMQCYE